MAFLTLRMRVSLAVLAVIALALAPAAAVTTAGASSTVQHVLLISVDGLHQSDLDWYVHKFPNSALASLVAHGVEFTGAQTPVPSDSFPGMVGQVTGGNPGTTGVYYDDSWNHGLLPAGTKNCAGVTPGVEVTYFEQLDKDPLALDAGQGLSGLPDSILNMTGTPQDLIDPSQLPVDPATCKPVYPHQYLRVNTIFEVARGAGLRTAWVDKHPAYEILNGPSGTGVQDLFAPEINSQASVAGSDWTKDNGLTQMYDSYKVQAVLNEIHGFDHSGKTQVGEPAIFGMNFQTVSTAEKLPSGGYMPDGVTPSPLLEAALNYVNDKIGQMVAALNLGNTVVILSAKHGQSPDTPSALTRISDGKVIDALNAAWKAAGHSGDLVAFSIDDDGVYMWLNDRSQAAADFAKTFLLGYSGKGTDITGVSKAFTQSGLATVYAGADAAAYFHIPAGDTVGMQRVPDLVGVTQVGTVYTGGTGKIAEHGGANPQDRDVPLVVSGGNVNASVQSAPVETTQIAPTILSLLGLDPNSLQAVQQEHTPTLPLGSGAVTSKNKFVVSFTSSQPGQGMVYFGSGPGCNGLVEVATQDSGAGTTTHTVVVQGNDLRGTVGDNGIVPGATYWYEAVTSTRSGQMIDNNQGQCYKVTIPSG
jgi:arylsulfatase A-like enzyme